MLLITGPSGEPVTKAELRSHAKLDSGEDDAMLDIYIAAARQVAEHLTGRALLPQTWEIAATAFPDEFVLPLAPIASVTSVKYWTSGVDTTLASNQYTLDQYGLAARVIPAYGVTWPSPDGRENGIRVRFVAGYADAASVPQAIRNWILIRAAEAVRHREETVDGGLSELPWIDSLLEPHRVSWGI